MYQVSSIPSSLLFQPFCDFFVILGLKSVAVGMLIYGVL